MIYAGKEVAVLGLGRSGEAAAALLAARGAGVTALDSAPPERLDAARIDRLRAAGIALVTGSAAETFVGRSDFAVLSPGIEPATALVQNFLGRGVRLIAEIELAAENDSTPVVAITGTNGKTTTTELTAAMFASAGLRTEAAGNIGQPYSEIVRAGRPLDLVTLEISSFQLERIERFRPAIAVWLNFTPDHLDRYATIEEYRAAKLRVFENQTAADRAVVNARDTLPPLAARRLTFSAFNDRADLHLRDGTIHHQDQPMLDPRTTKLRGLHNVENLMAALGIGLSWGLSAEQMRPALTAYRPQAHRCEVVRQLGGVTYVNDSKATNLDALEKALASEPAPVVLIAGGKDKGFEFDVLAPIVGQKARRVILLGEMAERIARAWHGQVPCETVGSLREAVLRAHAAAQPGEVVLFSPGTSSFDMFKSYADRGDQFRALVLAL